MLTAGAITCIFVLIKQMDGLTGVALLLGVLVGFYIAGLIAKKIIEKTIEVKEGSEAASEREMENIETGTDGEGAEETNEGMVKAVEEES